MCPSCPHKFKITTMTSRLSILEQVSRQRCILWCICLAWFSSKCQMTGFNCCANDKQHIYRFGPLKHHWTMCFESSIHISSSCPHILGISPTSVTLWPCVMSSSNAIFVKMSQSLIQVWKLEQVGCLIISIHNIILYEVPTHCFACRWNSFPCVSPNRRKRGLSQQRGHKVISCKLCALCTDCCIVCVEWEFR